MSKNFYINATLASIILEFDDKPMLKTSMVLSTLWVLVIMTFMPWAMPLLMADVQKSVV